MRFTKELFKKIKKEVIKRQCGDSMGVNIWADKTFEITQGLNSPDCWAYIKIHWFKRGASWEYFKQNWLEEAENEQKK